MMSPKPLPENRGSSHPATMRQAPLQIIHVVGNFMRIWSVYSMYRYLSQTGASVVLFMFCCLLPSCIWFLVAQKPWKGRALSNTQVVPSVVNGGITALYFILWGKGLKSCGPVRGHYALVTQQRLRGRAKQGGQRVVEMEVWALSFSSFLLIIKYLLAIKDSYPIRAILGEYSGAVLGVLSGVLYGRRGHVWKKVGGLLAMLASFYFLSQGWAMATYSPFPFSNASDDEAHTEQLVGMKEMLVPILAGVLSALRRVIARRVSLKNQLKRRLHAITLTSATCFLFPVAMWDMIIGSNNVELPFSAWAFSSTILFGMILIFYIDSIAEERLHMVFSSPRHLMVAGGCIIVMEIVYKMDFSLLGFLACAAILGVGIYEATSLDRSRRDSFQGSSSNGILDDQLEMSPLPT